VARHQAYSEATARKIDEEVDRLVADAYARATQMLAEHRARLDVLVEHLLEAETMDGRDVEDLVKEGRILNDAERAAKKQVGADATEGAPAQSAAGEPPPQPANEASEPEGASEPPPLPWLNE